MLYDDDESRLPRGITPVWLFDALGISREVNTGGWHPAWIRTLAYASPSGNSGSIRQVEIAGPLTQQQLAKITPTLYKFSN